MTTPSNEASTDGASTRGASTRAPHIDEHGRPEPPEVAGEIETLLGFLDYQRATFAWRCSGLGDEEVHRTLAPTSMTLGGMLRHLTFVEDYWFSLNVGQDMPEPWRSVDWGADPDWDWHTAVGMGAEELREHWRQRTAASRSVLAAAMAAAGEDPLATTVTRFRSDQVLSLRWVVTHMIEEYARHNGHADLLREAIDGQTGE